MFSFEFFIALRYIRSKRRTAFISTITYLSFFGIAIGVAVLTIVLSVMNGFEHEVKSRFIGNDSHLRVRGYGDRDNSKKYKKLEYSYKSAEPTNYFFDNETGKLVKTTTKEMGLLITDNRYNEQNYDGIMFSDSMNTALKETKNVSLIIEATAGQGSNLGYKFEHLAFLIENSIDKSRVGVCIDTCHIYAAGYDIGSSKESFNNVMSEFDRIIGIKYLKGMHLNDSKSTLGNKKDRHHSIGLGELGEDTFKWIMQDERFDNIPMVLETIDDNIWDKEIELLYSFV